MYCVNGKYFADLYHNRTSGYADWRDRKLCCGFYFNAANIGPYMSLDETCLSNGETMRQILARSKHTLMMSQNKWTDTRRHRVNILFIC
ncbi:MAG: hypothetical protein K2F96_05540 [Muribaculaceae bacterium]|nr:hypothetical protein [Muribaculaceae bacterium]